MILVTSPSSPSGDLDRPMVSLPVDDVAVILGLLDLLCPEPGDGDTDAVQALAHRFRKRLSAAIAAAVEATREVRSA